MMLRFAFCSKEARKNACRSAAQVDDEHADATGVGVRNEAIVALNIAEVQDDMKCGLGMRAAMHAMMADAQDSYGGSRVRPTKRLR